MARVTLDGVQKVISLALVDDVEVGDYVILHVGYALNKLDPEEAEKTLALLAECGSAGMKYVDEYRDGKLARAIAATIRAEARPDKILSLHGVLRRPYPRHRALWARGPAAAKRADDPRARLSGLRAAGRAHGRCDQAGAAARTSRFAPMPT